MRYLILLVALFASCTPPAEPPPDSTSTEPAEPPVDPPEDPPAEPEGREPSDYILLARAQEVIDELNPKLQQNAWAGWRDIVEVYTNCSWALRPNTEALFPFTHSEMMELAKVGAGLDQEGAGFLARLPETNRRCAEEHPDHKPEFCGRSDVLRARLSEFRERLEAHLATATSLSDGLKGQPGYGSAWNSIKGFCEYQNRNSR